MSITATLSSLKINCGIRGLTAASWFGKLSRGSTAMPLCVCSRSRAQRVGLGCYKPEIVALWPFIEKVCQLWILSVMFWSLYKMHIMVFRKNRTSDAHESTTQARNRFSPICKQGTACVGGWLARVSLSCLEKSFRKNPPGELVQAGPRRLRCESVLHWRARGQGAGALGTVSFLPEASAWGEHPTPLLSFQAFSNLLGTVTLLCLLLS